jgi:hypothetical protein
MIPTMYQSIIDRWKKSHKILCHSLGIHDFDGQLDSYDKDTINSRIFELKQDLIYLDTIKLFENPLMQIEHKILRFKLNEELYRFETLEEHKINPLLWISPLLLIETSFATREFTSKKDRVRIIMNFQKLIPNYIEEAIKQLNPKLSRFVILRSIEILKSIIRFFQDKLFLFITNMEDNEITLQEWSEINKNAIQALTDFLIKLEDQYLLNSNSSPMLNMEQFFELLKNSEDLNFSYKELLEIGELELNRNFKKLSSIQQELQVKSVDDLLKIIQGDLPDKDNLTSIIESIFDKTKSFLIYNEILTLTDNFDHCKIVINSSNDNKFSRAGFNASGPFEVSTAKDAYFWLTWPNSSWTSDELSEYKKYMNLSNLHLIVFHECYPGHFIQHLYANIRPSKILNLLGHSLIVTEGWAHYAEGMIVDLGYSNYDSNKLKISQISMALLRACRLIVTLKIHCKKMMFEEAKQFFIDKAYLTSQAAVLETRRCFIDPFGFSYTLGKYLIIQLRSDYKAIQGNKFNLKDFHDRILSAGNIPISLVQDYLFLKG